MIEQTADGGYIAAGNSNSFGQIILDKDIWVVKLNPDGKVAWQKRYYGPDMEWSTSIQQTAEDGYIVAGRANSYGMGGNDIWILKLDADGTDAWQRTFGGAMDDTAGSIR